MLKPVDDKNLKDELETCEHILADSRVEKERHRVFNFPMNTLDSSFPVGKLDLIFDKLNCTTKVNVAFGFVLKNVEDGSCRLYYEHEFNTFLERSKI